MTTFQGGGWAGTGAYRVQRIDQGQDFEIPLNDWITSPGHGEIVEHAADQPFPNGFGSPYAVVRIDDGRFGGRTYYVGHCNADVRPVGTKLAPGDHIARANNSLNSGWGWCELGLWPPGPMGNGNQIAHLFVPVNIGPTFVPLKHGSQGKRVVRLTRRLHFMRRPRGAAYLPRFYYRFKPAVVTAVRGFQRDHGLSDDGVVGIHTQRKIDEVFKAQYARRHGR